MIKNYMMDIQVYAKKMHKNIKPLCKGYKIRHVKCFESNDLESGYCKLHIWQSYISTDVCKLPQISLNFKAIIIDK